MIPVLKLSTDAQRIERILAELRLDPAEIALNRGKIAQANAAVAEVLQAVAERGDAAIVDLARRFDDPNFSAEKIRVSRQEMADAHARIPADQLAAIRRSIAQVREYQQHVMPPAHPPLQRDGVELGIRFTPLDSAGLYIPGGKASYPSSVIMLAVPAQVAGVKRIVICTPPSRFASDLVLGTCHELGLGEVFRASGTAAIPAMAFGTATIPAVDKILGPGNLFVQLAKRALAGCVGIDGFLGPSEILTLADDSANPAFIASDLLAQAEHDPGSSFLLTTSQRIAQSVLDEIARQMPSLQRTEAIRRGLSEHSAIIVDPSLDALTAVANRFAAEHVNLQTADNDAVLKKLTHGGAFFVGPYSPVAAGDYIAGPSHSLPTNTTARFSSGVSVYEFLKRSSIERYERPGLENDAEAIITLATAEHLDAHASSVRVRVED